jgi:hypothetical protein
MAATIAKKPIFWWLTCCFFIVVLNLCIVHILHEVVLTLTHNNEDDYPNKNKNNMFPMLLENVLLNDVVWVPERSMIVFLACRPDLFSRKKLLANVKPEDKLVQIGGVRREDLQSPLTLEKGLTLTMKTNNSVGGAAAAAYNNASNSFSPSTIIELQSCYEVPSPEVSDSNVANATYIVQCRYDGDPMMMMPSYHNDDDELLLWYNDQRVAKFSKQRWNAAPSMQFRRTVKKKENKDDFSVSVLIKGVFQYTEYIVDVLDYYRKQGIAHVYLGVFPMGGEVHAQYKEALFSSSSSKHHSNFTGFVSFGGMDESAVTFTSLGKNGWKLSYLQSALYHAKSFDDMLLVVDIDELLTATMKPTEQSIVSILRDLPDRESTCYYKVSSNVATSPSQPADDHNNSNSNNALVRLSPNRCDGGGHAAYFKSVAVLNNCDFLGFHKHGECRNGTTPQRKVDRNVTTILHFTDLWSKRWDLDTHMKESLSAQAKDTQQQLQQPMVCNVTNEYTTFVRSGVSFAANEQGRR